MPRSNPQVDSCNRTIDLLRKQIERMRQDPPDIPFAGCGDSSCITTDGLGGMHTNGGCRCDERALRRAVSYWRQVAVRRQVAIQDMLRGERPSASSGAPNFNDYDDGFHEAIGQCAEYVGAEELRRAFLSFTPLHDGRRPETAMGTKEVRMIDYRAGFAAGREAAAEVATAWDGWERDADRRCADEIRRIATPTGSDGR